MATRDLDVTKVFVDSLTSFLFLSLGFICFGLSLSEEKNAAFFGMCVSTRIAPIVSKAITHDWHS